MLAKTTLSYWGTWGNWGNDPDSVQLCVLLYALLTTKNGEVMLAVMHTSILEEATEKV